MYDISVDCLGCTICDEADAAKYPHGVGGVEARTINCACARASFRHERAAAMAKHWACTLGQLRTMSTFLALHVVEEMRLVIMQAPVFAASTCLLATHTCAACMQGSIDHQWLPLATIGQQLFANMYTTWLIRPALC
jgi:hypothetical protein